ncbi:hypothetical protein EVAR_57199_1 [Eumeta japonica]|uniref:Lipase domain-containing protein n=1 Tax=Eumeta variegata TaxID=151549 RepID=A0A4C1YXB4_EUMVA|nr:hypothetical protein EVAR_57199_1 [Eumeta japonica]
MLQENEGTPVVCNLENKDVTLSTKVDSWYKKLDDAEGRKVLTKMILLMFITSYYYACIDGKTNMTNKWAEVHMANHMKRLIDKTYFAIKWKCDRSHQNENQNHDRGWDPERERVTILLPFEWSQARYEEPPALGSCGCATGCVGCRYPEAYDRQHGPIGRFSARLSRNREERHDQPQDDAALPSGGAQARRRAGRHQELADCERAQSYRRRQTHRGDLRRRNRRRSSATFIRRTEKDFCLIFSLYVDTGRAGKPFWYVHCRCYKEDLKRRKTLVYSTGFLDSAAWPHTRALANTYARKGFNVFVIETFDFFTYIYPKSVRLVRVVGEKLGVFLLHLKDLGLDADNLQLLGVSLGAHVVSHAAKHFHRQSGQKPFRISGLDPAGACFRNLPSDEKLNPNDAKFVDVVHTNIDGFGIAEPLGHVDFYANGGEYQPSDIVYIPCLVVCSHVRALIYWWIALDHPKKFVGVKCRSVEDARFSNCFDEPQELNYFGLETNFSKPGVYYLPTDHLFPYYRNKEGLRPENEIFSSVAREINKEELFVV